MKTSALALAGTLTGMTALLGAEPAATEDDHQLLQHELKQQEIKGSTQRVAEQLDAIIGEFQRNGIAGDDARILGAIRSVLDRLSAKDMARVIALLHQAREKSPDSNSSRQKATSAYSGQKGIILQLRQLLAEYHRQQALHDLAARFAELATKQTLNLKETAALVDLRAIRRNNQTDERQSLALQLAEIQEASIKDETAVVLDQLEKLTRETETDVAAISKSALDKALSEALVPRLEEAVSHLKSADPARALTGEKKARDLMRELSRMLGSPRQPSDALRDAMAELDQIIEQEKSLIAMTKQLGKTVKDSQGLQNRQGEIADRTDLLRQDLKDMAGATPQHLDSSLEKMEEARATLAQRQSPPAKRDPALRQENEALAKLLEAKKSLTDEAARADLAFKKPQDTLAAMTNLLDQVRQIKDEQKKIQEASASAPEPQNLKKQAAKQSDIKNKTTKAEEQVTRTLPKAAKSLAEAASEMAKAEKSLDQASPADQPQQAAMEALTKAEKDLSEKANELKQAKENLGKLANLKGALEKAIGDEQTLQLETAKTAAAKSAPLQTLAPKQDAVRQNTGQLQKQAAATAPKASQSLAKASQNMAQARQNLDRNSPAPAQQSEQDALDDLYDAREQIENRMNDLAQALGLPKPQNQQNLADAASAIEKAMNHVDNAMEKLQLPPGELEKLQKEQQELASTVHDLSGTADTGGALPKATQQDAQSAANELQKAHLPNAIASMEKSEAGLTQATQAALKNSPPAKAPFSELAKTQENIKTRAQGLASMNAQDAIPPLENAAGLVGPLAAGKAGPLPPAALAALQEAQSAIAKAAAQAAANQGMPAQAQAESAQDALSEAAAALSMAQQGIGQTPSQQAKNGKGNQRGKGRQSGKPEGEGQEGESSSNRPPSQANTAGADGPRRTAQGTGKFIGLPRRDRAAIQQSQAEKYPQEYGAAIEQYLRNLSEESGRSN